MVQKHRIFLPGVDRSESSMTLVAALLGNHDRLIKHPHFMNGLSAICRDAKSVFEIVDSAAESDVCIYPKWLHFSKGTREAADAVCEIAERANRPAIFFQLFDHGIPFVPRYGFVFHPSVFASRRHPREFAMAPQTDDILLYTGNQVDTRPKSIKPIVSFCGNAGDPAKDLALLMLGRPRNAVGMWYRRRTLAAIRRCSDVETRFVLRSGFWGGCVTKTSTDEVLRARLREEYVRNVIDSDYVLCIRGAGNFSFRFYEALSAGRIPLLIDTDCYLPFQNTINWNEHCIVVPYRDIHKANEIILAFHEKLTAESFRQLQFRNRQLWEQYLCPLAFYSQAVEFARAYRGDLRQKK